MGKENSMWPEVKSYRLQAEKETGPILEVIPHFLIREFA